MTETSPLTTMNPDKGERKLGSIGLPLLNTDIRLVDPGTGREVAVGEPGEICVKGPQVMAGYYNNPDETRQVFDADGYLHTGDVAVQDEEGYLRIVDRTKNMIIVGGFKVFSKKVEEVLVEHPAIDMIAIIGLPDPERPGSEHVKAVVALKPDFDSGDDQGGPEGRHPEDGPGEACSLRGAEVYRHQKGIAPHGPKQDRQESPAEGAEIAGRRGYCLHEGGL